MSLTIKQQRFCEVYVQTGNASEAYRQSYNCENMQESSVNVNACKMLADAKVAQRIDEIRKPVRDAVRITLKAHLETLERLREKAESEGKYTAAIQAEINRGKASGLYVDRVSIEDAPAPTIVINRPDGD